MQMIVEKEKKAKNLNPGLMDANRAGIARREPRRQVVHEVTPFCSRFNQGESVRIRIVNCSKNGLCFESDAPFSTGQVLQIRITDFSDKDFFPDSTPCLRSNSLAEVKWCRSEKSPKGRTFLVGVKYF